MSLKSWLVGEIVPGVSRAPLKSLRRMRPGTQAVDAMLAGASKPSKELLDCPRNRVVAVRRGVVVQLKDALSTVWEVVARKKGAYLVSLAGVLALGFLLLVSLLLSTALSASGKYLSPHLPEAALHIVGMATANDEEDRDTILTAGLPATCITAGHSYGEDRWRLRQYKLSRSGIDQDRLVIRQFQRTAEIRATAARRTRSKRNLLLVSSF